MCHPKSVITPWRRHCRPAWPAGVIVQIAQKHPLERPLKSTTCRRRNRHLSVSIDLWHCGPLEVSLVPLKLSPPSVNSGQHASGRLLAKPAPDQPASCDHRGELIQGNHRAPITRAGVEEPAVKWEANAEPASACAGEHAPTFALFQKGIATR